MAFDWEECALRLLEQNLNGHSLNANTLKEIFPQDILADLNIMDNGNAVDNLDEALYGGHPQVIEIREAKPTEIYHCKACNRSFKRRDNFRRHMISSLHQRRQKAMELEARQHEKEKQEVEEALT